jgi:hypothetical protein
MSQLPELSGDDALCAELWRLGIHFVNSAPDSGVREMAPVDLVCGLAESRDARVQLAVISLLLALPRFGEVLPSSAVRLSGEARVLLMCYAHAAAPLQREHASRLDRLSQWLPTPFGVSLDLPSTLSAKEQLDALAQRQGELCGGNVNWLATYEQAAARMLARWAWEAECAA